MLARSCRRQIGLTEIFDLKIFSKTQQLSGKVDSVKLVFSCEVLFVAYDIYSVRHFVNNLQVWAGSWTVSETLQNEPKGMKFWKNMKICWKYNIFVLTSNIVWSRLIWFSKIIPEKKMKSFWHSLIMPFICAWDIKTTRYK